MIWLVGFLILLLICLFSLVVTVTMKLRKIPWGADWIKLSNWVSIFVVVGLFFVFWEMRNYPKVIIEPISMPDKLEKVGYKPEVVAHRLNDSLQQSLGQRSKGFKATVRPPGSFKTDILFTEMGISLKSIAAYLVSAFSVQSSPRFTVSGEFNARPGGCFSLRLRVDGETVGNIPEICDINDEDKVRELFLNASDRVIRSQHDKFKLLYPCGLATFYYNKYITSSQTDIYKSETKKLIDFVLMNHDAENRACAFNLKGMLHLKGREIKYAIEAFQKAIHNHNDFVDAYENWGYALLLNQKHDNAIDKLSEAIGRNSRNASAYLYLGYVYAAKKDYSAAAIQYKKAVALDEKHFAPYFALGNALAAQKKYSAAIQQYEKAVDLQQTYDLLYVYLGFALSQTGEYDSAIEQYKKATEINPDYSLPYHEWGHALVEKGDFHGAIEQFEKASQLDPKNAELYRHWGDGLARTGDCEDAAKKYMKAAELDNSHDDIHIAVCVPL